MLFQTARLRFPRHQTTVKNIVHACKACQQMRPGKGQHAGLRYWGEGPGQHWKIYFARQVWLPVLVSVGGYLLRVDGGFSYKRRDRDDSGDKDFKRNSSQ